MSEAIVRLESEISSLREDDARTRNPVGLLAIDEMTDDVEWTERVGSFCAANPRFIQAVEQASQCGRRSAKDARCQCEIEVHDGLYPFRAIGASARSGQRLDTRSITAPLCTKPSNVRIGTQGWNYDAWVGPFFPEGTRPADFLALYSRAFNTVEVDSTFYATPSEKMVAGWAERTPDDFVFALKLPQEITHERRLRDSKDLLAQFLERARILGPKLGPILVQLGPDFGPSELPALAAFLPLLPADIRVAIEFRDRGWIHDGIIALLAEHEVALALTDARWIPRRTMLSLAERPTTRFSYIRWMGPSREIVDYSRIQVDRSRELEQWAELIVALSQRVTEVYGYVNNHFAGHSPQSARELQRLLGQRPVEPSELGEQLSLF